MVPGGAIALALRIKGFDVLALAPVLSLGAIGLSALLGGAVDIAWNPISPVVLGALAAGLLWLGRRALIRFRPPPVETAAHASRVLRNGIGLGVWLGLAAAVAFGVVHTLNLIGWDLENFSDAFDNVFHLNAIRYIMDHGNASPFFLSTMTTGGEKPYFYPDVWHALGALVTSVTGVSVPAATNVMTIWLISVVWPASMMFFVRTLSRNRYAWFLAGVLSNAFAAFPSIFMFWGILYPNLMSYTVVPAVLGLGVCALRVGSPVVTRGRALILGVGALGGMALAHPSGVLVCLAVILPAMVYRLMYLIRWIIRGRRVRRSYPAIESLLVLIFIAGIPIIWALLRPANAVPQNFKITPIGESVVRVLAMAPAFDTPGYESYPISIVGVVVLLVGAGVLVVQRKNIWLLCSYGLVGLLLIAGMTFAWPIRNILTGAWYNDRFRVSAILPMVGVPIIALGFGALCVLVRRYVTSAWGHENRGRRRAFTRTVVVVVGVGLFIPLATNSTMVYTVSHAQERFRISPTSQMVTSDRYDVMSQTPQFLGPGEKVINNPWTGGGMAYGLFGITTTSHHLLEKLEPDDAYLSAHLNEAFVDPQVCTLVTRNKAYYVLDFAGKPFLNNNGGEAFAGLANLEAAGVATPVYQSGEARLLRIDVCE